MTNAVANSLPLAQFYPQNLLIESVLAEDNEIHIKMHSQTPKCNCPKCMMESSSLHATHHRKVQDLPIYGKRVMLDINLYEFNCVNPKCSITSFTETFENFSFLICHIFFPPAFTCIPKLQLRNCQGSVSAGALNFCGSWIE